MYGLLHVVLITVLKFWTGVLSQKLGLALCGVTWKHQPGIHHMVAHILSRRQGQCVPGIDCSRPSLLASSTAHALPTLSSPLCTSPILSPCPMHCVQPELPDRSMLCMRCPQCPHTNDFVEAPVASNFKELCHERMSSLDCPKYFPQPPALTVF